MKRALDFFNGDELRARIFYEKYALRNEKGEVLEETPEDMWKRILKGRWGWIITPIFGGFSQIFGLCRAEEFYMPSVTNSKDALFLIASLFPSKTIA